MLYNIKVVHLHCVFHGIRFKVNEDWVSVIDTLLFFMKVAGCGLRFFLILPRRNKGYAVAAYPSLFVPSRLIGLSGSVVFGGYSFGRYMGEGLHSAFQAEFPQFCIGDVFLFRLVVDIEQTDFRFIG